MHIRLLQSNFYAKICAIQVTILNCVLIAYSLDTEKIGEIQACIDKYLAQICFLDGEKCLIIIILWIRGVTELMFDISEAYRIDENSTICVQFPARIGSKCGMEENGFPRITFLLLDIACLHWGYKDISE